jgi:hypothetical protein
VVATMMMIIGVSTIVRRQRGQGLDTRSDEKTGRRKQMMVIVAMLSHDYVYINWCIIDKNNICGCFCCFVLFAGRRFLNSLIVSPENDSNLKTQIRNFKFPARAVVKDANTDDHNVEMGVSLPLIH